MWLMPSDAELTQRVERGSRLLDDAYGREWVFRIEPARLDLASNTACVLGQLAGHFQYGCSACELCEPGLSWSWTRSHGFLTMRAVGRLTSLWREHIARLRLERYNSTQWRHTPRSQREHALKQRLQELRQQVQELNHLPRELAAHR